MILALQLKKELNREEPTFMVILLVDKQIQIRFVSLEILEVLNEYVDIMSPQLLKTLPP